jgi:hypothetical protein
MVGTEIGATLGVLHLLGAGTMVGTEMGETLGVPHVVGYRTTVGTAIGATLGGGGHTCFAPWGALRRVRLWGLDASQLASGWGRTQCHDRHIGGSDGKERTRRHGRHDYGSD